MAITHKEASVSVDLYTNLYLGRADKAKEIVEVLLRHGNIFVPQRFDIGTEENRPHWIEFETNLERALLEMSESEFPGLVAKRKKPVKVDYVFSPSLSQMFDWVSVAVQEKWFADATRIQAFIEFAKDLYSTMEAASGYIQHDLAEQHYDWIETVDGKGRIHGRPRFQGIKHNLRGLFWASFLGPEFVEMWDQGFLKKSPCHRVEDLPDGGTVLFLSESPLDAKEAWYEERKKKLYQYLGYEAFDGRRYPKFRTQGRWRKKRDARPLIETGGVLDDVFADEPPPGTES